jgi:hypothetical protein
MLNNGHSLLERQCDIEWFRELLQRVTKIVLQVALFALQTPTLLSLRLGGLVA